MVDFSNFGLNAYGIGISALAGMLSFLSPCVLPIVPSYIAFVSGLTLGELVETVQLPERFRDSYLTTEFYGMAQHHVRQIHGGVSRSRSPATTKVGARTSPKRSRVSCWR